MELASLSLFSKAYTQVFNHWPWLPSLWFRSHHKRSHLSWFYSLKAHCYFFSVQGVYREVLCSFRASSQHLWAGTLFFFSFKNCLPNTWSAICSVCMFSHPLLVIIIFTCLAESAVQRIHEFTCCDEFRDSLMKGIWWQKLIMAYINSRPRVWPPLCSASRLLWC